MKPPKFLDAAVDHVLANKPKPKSKHVQGDRDGAHTIRIAAGLLSTHPQFSDKHQEEVLRFIQDAAIDAARKK